MQFSTTPTLEGQTIVEYCGVVTGEAILGANIFRDFFAGIRDIVGGRSGAYEKELRKAREIAFEDRILVDAPCSGTGVIRRHPDIKWLRRKKDIDVLIQTQEKILDNAFALLDRKSVV